MRDPWKFGLAILVAIGLALIALCTISLGRALASVPPDGQARLAYGQSVKVCKSATDVEVRFRGRSVRQIRVSYGWLFGQDPIAIWDIKRRRVEAWATYGTKITVRWWC